MAPPASVPSFGLMLYLARRSLFQNKLIAGLMIAAVAAGVGFQIPNSANTLGYDAEILEKGLRHGFGDVRIRPKNASILREADALAATLRDRPDVLEAVPALTLAGSAGRGGRFQNSLVLGVDPRFELAPYTLTEGTRLPPGDDAGCILGTSVAQALEVKVGDEVQVRVILTTSVNDLVGEDTVGRYTMTVRGIASSAFVAPRALIVDRSFLADELGEPDSASVIMVHLPDHWDAESCARAMSGERPELETLDWQTDNPFMASAIKSSTALRNVSYAMVLFAVLIPLWALLYINMLYNRRQVGVLGAIGFGRGTVFGVFLLQSLVVGVLGVAIGLGIGYGLVQYFSANPIFEMEGFSVEPIVGTDTFVRPAALVFLVSVVAGVFPAYRASRIDPTVILRHVE